MARVATPGCWRATSPATRVVRVFTYQADPACSPEETAEEAFAIRNDHPRDARGQDLARRYYQRELRSLPFRNVAVLSEVMLRPSRRGVAWSLERGQPAPGGIDALMAGSAGDEVRR
jgi:hypothetical protein